MKPTALMTWRHSLPINPDSPTPLVDGTELKGFWLDDRWRCYSEDVATPTESLHQLHRNIITVASTRGYFIPTHFILHSSFWTKKKLLFVIEFQLSFNIRQWICIFKWCGKRWFDLARKVPIKGGCQMRLIGRGIEAGRRTLADLWRLVTAR